MYSQDYCWLLGAGTASATSRGAVERTKIVLDFWFISALLSLFCSPASCITWQSFFLLVLEQKKGGEERKLFLKCTLNTTQSQRTNVYYYDTRNKIISFLIIILLIHYQLSY